ncbi:MAG: recombinase RecQ [Polaromonas sp.]|nr:recombinase RecQ [Polaromonas sp.]
MMVPASAGADPELARRIETTLRRNFGLRRLREGQETVITRVLQGQATLAIMPTGAGKSLCYQLPAVLLAGRTLVVSPLIALMNDQCENLNRLGIAAVQLNSSLDAATLQAAEQAVADGSARIVLTTPERLADAHFAALLKRHPVSLLVVDEAHCISQWGHDFRPAFLEIAPALRQLAHPTVLALTATATESVMDDIRAQLGIGRSGIVNTGAYRANLHYQVEQVSREEDKLEKALALVRATPGCGLVYAATVKAAEAVYQALHGAGESVGRYHGKLTGAERHAAQEAFMDGDVRVMVATNAFGLGINKPDIRFVLHYQMPAGLDAYYQESGRAGRDGQEACCTLLFLRSDKAVQQFFMSGRYPDSDDVLALYQALQQEPPGESGESDGGPGWPLSRLKGRLGRAQNKLKVAASLLRRQRIVGQYPGGNLYLIKKNLQPPALQALVTAYRDKREQDQETLEKMVFYAQAGQCRWQLLLAYLQEQADFTHCGSCDNCRRIAVVQAELAAQARQPAEPALALAGQAAQAVAQGDPSLTFSPAGASATPPAPPIFKPDDTVKVKRYGQGRVVAADALSVTVEFEPGCQRSFHAAYVQGVRPRLARGKAR